MERILFEILKVRLQRHFMSLEKSGFIRDDHPGKDTRQTWRMLEEWIRKSENAYSEIKQSRSSIAQFTSLHKKFRGSWQWRIGKAFNGMIESVLRRNKEKANPFIRLDNLQEELESYIQSALKPVNPYLFSSISSNFTGPATFPSGTETVKGKVAYIILNRNGHDHLTKLLSSFLEFNSYPDSEFIIVDHNSTDNSLEVINTFRDRLCIRVIPFSLNFSYSYSNNFAAGLSNAEYLFFLNNDIIFDQDVTGGLVDLLRKDPGAGIVAPALYLPDQNFHRSEKLQHAGIRFYYRKRTREHIKFIDSDPPSFFILDYKYSHLFRDALVPVNSTSIREGLSSHPAICTAAALCRKEDFILAGGFDENYFYGYEDVDFSLSILKKLGKKLYLAGNFGMIHNESFTRRRDGLYKSALKIHNLTMLTNKYGYFVRYNLLSGLYSPGNFWSEEQPNAAVIIKDGRGKSLAGFKMAELMEKKLGWKTTLVNTEAKESIPETADLVIFVGDCDYKPSQDNFKESLLGLHLPEDYLRVFDFENDAEKLRQIVLDHVTGHLNLAFRCPMVDNDHPGHEDIKVLSNFIESYLPGESCHVRTDLFEDWYWKGTMRDQVVFSVSGHPVYYPQPGQINVLWIVPGLPVAHKELLPFYDLVVIKEDAHIQALGIKDQLDDARVHRTGLFNQKPDFVLEKNALKDRILDIHKEKAGLR
jgi:GT2 family glycosyltransferase